MGKFWDLKQRQEVVCEGLPCGWCTCCCLHVALPSGRVSVDPRWARGRLRRILAPWLCSWEQVGEAPALYVSELGGAWRGHLFWG